MKKTFTLNYILKNMGCYIKDNKHDFISELFGNRKSVNIQTLIQSNKIPFKDRAWFLCYSCDLSKKQKVNFAIGCAEIVVNLYNNKYPNDKRVDNAIVAAKEYIMSNTIADAAAYAAYADAAAAAAYADATAAYAAAAAADGSLMKSLESFTLEFVKNEI